MLRAFRTRLRDPGAGEARWLAREVDRTAALAGDGARPAHPRGRPGRAALLVRDAARRAAAEPGWRAEGTLPVEAAELAWLGAALA